MTGILYFLGGMMTTVIINYFLKEPDHQIEDYEYRNSGHYGPKE